MKKIEVSNVKEVIEKKISPDGKIWGLKEWADKKATIIITED